MGKIKNHRGVFIDSEIVTTGVVGNNEPEWLIEEIRYPTVDLDFEAHCEECANEDHDFCYEGVGSETLLIGDWCQATDGLYIPDENGEHGYSAIVGEIYTQVVWSRWTRRCALCSPCYPGQGDLDSPRDDGQLCYDLPPEIWGEYHPDRENTRENTTPQQKRLPMESEG